MNTITLGATAVGEGHPPYIIAEIGSNHNGDMDLCRRLIDAAADAGAHAVKFQSWSESSLIAEEEYDRNPEYSDKKKHFGSLREMVRAYQLTPEQHVIAQGYCTTRGVEFCSSAFSPEEADLLESLDVPFFKIASMDIVNLPLLALRGRQAAAGAHRHGHGDPGGDRAGGRDGPRRGQRRHRPPALRLHLSARLRQHPPAQHRRCCAGPSACPWGSATTRSGTSVPLAAIALGACIIEKHFTVDKDMAGWDHAISADPEELRTIVEEGRHVFDSLGGRPRVVTEAEIEKRERFRRSLVARRGLGRGHVLTEDDLTAKRPGSGISPAELRYVVGRRLADDLEEDHVLRWEDLQ